MHLMNTPIAGTITTIATAKTRKGEEKAVLTLETAEGPLDVYVFPKQMPQIAGLSVNDQVFVHGFKATIALYHPLGTVKALEVHTTLEAYTAAREAAAVRKAAWEAEQAAKGVATEEAVAA
jgi:DNA polymerase III alpha subunit